MSKKEVANSIFVSKAPPLFHLKKGESMMEQIIPFISEVGFPIVVTLYLLHRIEAKLDVVIQSIQSLPERLNER
ncbi:hypothetical protein MGA3_08000 [Bacillus methanolicus MGA3]|nr:hypothetical protein MGA3_08000 [Bacillus methanolicus MGA3]